MSPSITKANPYTLPDARKRALYRAEHRGTKEMDWLVGRYARACLGNMTDTEFVNFEALLQEADPVLENWIVRDAKDCPENIIGHILNIRQFANLTDDDS